MGQQILFFISYGVVGSLLSSGFWVGHFQFWFSGGSFELDVFQDLFVLFFCMVFLFITVGRLVPAFAIVMALPPFYGRKNDKSILHVAQLSYDAPAQSALSKVMSDVVHDGAQNPDQVKQQEKLLAEDMLALIN